MVKVGDKVRLTVDRYGAGFTGDIVTVTDVDNFVDDGLPIEVDGVVWIRKDQFEPICPPQTGTLQELNVKPGDVVKCVDDFCGNYTNGKLYTVNQDSEITSELGACSGITAGITVSEFRIISRASDNTPKKWRDMSDEEKGALLLAHHRGEVIEHSIDGNKWGWCCPSWGDGVYYRIKPEPVRETKTIYIDYKGNPRTGYYAIDDTARITFDTLDGEPDPDTIKMEKL